MAKEDFDMVREYSEHLLELRPDSTVALEGLASWACAAGEHALTAKFCTLLVSAVPAHFEGWFNLALAHQKSGRFEQAEEAYEEALKLRPRSCEAHTNLGIVREQLGDVLGARAAYDKAMKAGPSAGAALEHGPAAGALRPVRRSRALVQAGAGARSEGRRSALPHGLPAPAAAKTSAARSKPSKAA